MDFRKKLLILSISAMAFAGVASAQALFPCGANDAGSINTTGLPNILRVEGTNDLVTDVTVSCLAGSTLLHGSVVVQLNANINSKQVSATVNEATLLIIQGGVVIAGGEYQGVVSGNQVVFGGNAGVTFPATAFTIEVSNIRVNSSTLAIGTYVTSTLNVYNQGVVAYTTNSATVTNGGLINVGYVQQGFGIPSITAMSLAAPYPICQPNNTQSFQITIAEKFGGAFKTALPGTITPGAGVLNCPAGSMSNCTETNGEQGSYYAGSALAAGGPAVPAGVGTASSGTRFQLAFAGIPSGVTVYLPVTYTNGTLTLVLTASATGPFSALTASIPMGSGLPAGDVAIAATNGTATAIYEVTVTDNTVPTESASIPGVLFFAANFSQSAPAAPTVTVTPAPTGTPANVPNFVTSANPALTLNTFAPCTTSLLFPFVTNQLGFDTGIVLANTSTDAFGKGGASPAPGTCALNFFGVGAPTNPVPAPGGSQASGTTNAFQLSAVAPGFQGYLISTCNYLFGHGYAFIEYNLTQGNGVAEGYLPLVISGTRGQAAAAEALEN